jgi:hypothetical protein
MLPDLWLHHQTIIAFAVSRRDEDKLLGYFGWLTKLPPFSRRQFLLTLFVQSYLKFEPCFVTRLNHILTCQGRICRRDTSRGRPVVMPGLRGLVFTPNSSIYP